MIFCAMYLLLRRLATAQRHFPAGGFVSTCTGTQRLGGSLGNFPYSSPCRLSQYALASTDSRTNSSGRKRTDLGVLKHLPKRLLDNIVDENGDPKDTKMGKGLKLWREYGYIGIGVHATVYFTCLGGGYVAIESGAVGDTEPM